GQRLARLLDAEGVRYVALDLDPERVREAALAGDNVVFADSSRREALMAAGISRAVAAVVTFAECHASLRVLAHIHALNPAAPGIVRARDEADIAPLTAAGATEVVPEAFESGVMLASHTLVVVGVPLSRVMRRVRNVRDQQYALLRGLFPGAADEPAEDAVSRLQAVTLEEGAYAVGRTLAEISLDNVQVRAVRRPGSPGSVRRRPADGRARCRRRSCHRPSACPTRSPPCPGCWPSRRSGRRSRRARCRPRHRRSVRRSVR